MPELPVLGPPGPVALGGHVPHLPTTLPVSQAIEQGAKEIEGNALTLLKGIRLQSQKTADAQAIVNYTNQVNGLYKQVAPITDYDKQYKTFSQGLGKIRDDLIKNVPNLSDYAVKSLAEKID